MSRIPTLAGLCLLGLSTLLAQKTPQGLPPLIDRELLFGNPEIAAAQLSPDGKYISFLKPWKDTRNIWVKKIDEPFTAAHLLTTETKRPIAGYQWSRDAKFILYVKDNDGDENFNVFAVDPAASTPAGADAPPSRDLTGLKGVRVALYAAPKSDPNVVYIGLNDRDKAWHDLYKLTLSSGERTLLRKNTERIAGWIFDRTGQLRLAQRVTDSGDQEVLRVDAGGFTKIYGCSVFETCDVVRFHKDGKLAYIETNHGDNQDLSALMLLDPQSGKIDIVESDPLKKVDFGAAIFSEDKEELVATAYEDDRTRRYFKDRAFESDFKWLEGKMPRREVNIVSRTADDKLWLVLANGDTEPGQVFLFDRALHTLAPQYKMREKLPRQDLAPMTAIRYKSSDGLEIPAYLTLPRGVPPKHLPTVVVPHGGPWARDGWGYNSLAQFFANRGYAVLMPNFRGSTGYGKKFLNAGNGEWGKKMQDDITWGVRHLIAEGTADPKRVGILGGSYGGYATLAGVTFTPDLYRAAVDIVGPSNLMTLLEAIPPYWEAGRKIMYSRMADPGTPDGKKWMEERSPLTYADKIKTPLMVVQGANDPRVNRREAEQIVVALRDRGFKVEYLLAPDEGHGFARPVNNMAMFMAAERFLAQQLDGRYQADGKPEVVARLKEITVDPKSVVITKPVEASSAPTAKPTMPLKAGVYRYAAKIAMGTQELALKITTTVKEDNGAWVVTDEMESPMGQALDTATLDKSTLELKKRTIKQGPMTVNLTVDGGKISGTMNMGGQEKPVNADLGGPDFADAAGGPQCIATLPLAEGYKTTFRNFDVQKQKLKLQALAVTGSENVTVPAGSFDAFKVEISPADGSAGKTTMWIAKDSRQVVKMASVMPQMGGATLTAELQ